MSELFRFKGHANAKTLSFSSDGGTVCAWHDESFRDAYGSAVVWDIGERMELATFGHENGLRRAVLSPDGKSAYAITGQGQWNLLGWDTGAEKPLDGAGGRLEAAVSCLAISPDGATIAASDDNRKVHLLDGATRQKKTTLEGYEAYTVGLAFTPDGKYLVALGNNREFAIWLLARGKLKAVPAFSADIAPGCIAVSPDSATLAVGDDAQANRPCAALLDLSGGGVKPGFAAAPLQRCCVGIAYSADGKVLAALSNDTLVLMDAATGALRKQMDAPEAYCVGFTPDGKHLLIGAARDITVHDAAALLS